MNSRLGFVFLMFALPACAGSDASTTRSTNTHPVVAPKAMTPRAPVAKAACESAAACESLCAEKVAAACTIVALEKVESNPRTAAAILEASCTENDPKACNLLFEMSTDPGKAAEYARQGCELGGSGACDYVAEYAALAFAGPRRTEDRDALFALSLQASERGCELGSYEGCQNALTLHKFKKSKQDVLKPFADKALLLAEAACAKRRIGSCWFVAEWAEAANDVVVARAARTGECQIDQRTRPQAPLTKLESCQKALEHGADEADLKSATQSDSNEPKARIIPQKALREMRVSGRTQIPPPNPEAKAIAKAQEAAITTVKICVSPRGEVTSISLLRPSSYPGWNRLIFEEVKGWRYKATPERVCSPATFVYKGS